MTEIKPMNYERIDDYMEKHDFLLCDKKKIKNFIENENRMRKGKHKFVDGYLTRTNLYLVTGYELLEECPRMFLGIQDNFK